MKTSITTKWVGEGPLDAVCLSIVEESLLHGIKPSGTLLAHLAKRLIAAETAPGGPYYNNEKVVDPYTNLAVGYLFAYLGTPLPGVGKFIETTRRHLPSAFSAGAAASLLKKYDELAFEASQKPQKASSSSAPVYRMAKTQLSLLEEPLKSLALSFVARIERADKNQEIALLPTFFYNSLISPLPSPPLLQLGQANIYCWLAYTVYDHLLDGEPITQHLSAANTAARFATTYYQSLFPSHHPFTCKVQNILTTMDTANAWEGKYCRFKREGDVITITTLPLYGHRSLLARRSFGHALGPLALCYLNEYRHSQISAIERGFRHYLIARQLRDDLLDWQDDLSVGQCSFVVTSLLKKARVTPGSYTLASLLARLQPLFWSHAIPTTNALIYRHIRLSEEAFLKSGVIKKDNELLTLLTHLTKSITHVEQERQRAEDFSTTYKQLF